MMCTCYNPNSCSASFWKFRVQANKGRSHMVDGCVTPSQIPFIVANAVHHKLSYYFVDLVSMA